MQPGKVLPTVAKFLHLSAKGQTVVRETCKHCTRLVPVNLLRLLVQGSAERPRGQKLCPRCLHDEIEYCKQHGEWFRVQEYKQGGIVEAAR